jgi:hypothetical protein
MMPAINKRLRSENGQILILGALAVLLVALMMLLTLNVGQAVHEKIRVQQLADSAAFSMATQEARAFNFFAYTNRANIANLVAANSAHAYLGMATMVVEINMAAAINFFAMSGMEIARCCKCPKCSCVQHCFHAAMDSISGIMYMIETFDLSDSVQEVDEKFEKLIDAIDAHMKSIADAQKDMKDAVALQLQSDLLVRQLKSRFAPQASANPIMVSSLNKQQFEDVFETDKDKRKWVPTEIANGTRDSAPSHPITQSLRILRDFEAFIKDDTYDDFKDGTPVSGESEIMFYIGSSRVIENPSSPIGGIVSGQHGPEGEGAGSWDMAMVHSEAYCDEMVMIAMSVLGSGDSGTHWGIPWPMVCGADHDNKFECLNGGECFMLFKANPEASEDWGQPKVYSFIHQDLRKMEEGGQGPWELNDSGKVKLDLGDVSGKYDTEMQLSNNPDERGEGMALSKALVYYHYPDYQDGGWKEHPNFFNPFWRAKLQPFRREEARNVLIRAGKPFYTIIVEAGAPLP